MGLSEVAAEVAAEQAAEKPMSKDKRLALGKIADLIEKSGIDIDEVGKINQIKVGTYQAITKDADGEAQTHDLERASLVLTPKWETGPEWPVIQPAAPVVIEGVKPPKKKARKTAALVRKWKTATVLPDPQIGFRQFEGGELDPFHDAAAIDVALQIVAAMEHDGGVDKNINLGDFLDLPSQSRFAQEPAFAGTMQAAIDYGHQFLAQQRAAAPNAEHVLIEGNHDKRLSGFIQANAAAAFGLRRANTPASWPVMSLPYLLRLEELNFKYIDAWPTGMYWINDKLRAMHGDKVASGSSTAVKMVKANPNVGTIHGHIHRIEMHSTTIFERVNGRTRPLRSGAYSPGCLCRIDGAVPSMKGSTGVDGRPAEFFEDWQQGVAIVNYTDDGDYRVTTHQIIDGVALIGGQIFEATVDKLGNPLVREDEENTLQLVAA